MSEIRKTYIIMYEQDGIRYIFNRSVDWNDMLGKDLQNILNVIGLDIVSDRIDEFVECHHDICSHISEIELFLNENHCIIIEACPELPNNNLKDQKELNNRKKYWCNLLNAVDRQDKLPVSDVELFKIKTIRAKLWDYVDNIYKEISKARKYKTKQFEDRIDELEESVEDWKNKQNLACKKWLDKERYEPKQVCINIHKKLESLIDQSKKDEYVLKHKKDIDGLITNILNGKYINVFK